MAIANGSGEKDIAKPGASLTTLAAVRAGEPVTIAAYTTQMARAALLKKKTENQSIAALVPRCRVGSAKAARTAKAGRPSIRARSKPPPATQASIDSAASDSGRLMWRLPR